MEGIPWWRMTKVSMQLQGYVVRKVRCLACVRLKGSLMRLRVCRSQWGTQAVRCHLCRRRKRLEGAAFGELRRHGHPLGILRQDGMLLRDPCDVVADQLSPPSYLHPHMCCSINSVASSAQVRSQLPRPAFTNGLARDLLAQNCRRTGCLPGSSAGAVSQRSSSILSHRTHGTIPPSTSPPLLPPSFDSFKPIARAIGFFFVRRNLTTLKKTQCQHLIQQPRSYLAVGRQILIDFRFEENNRKTGRNVESSR